MVGSSNFLVWKKRTDLVLIENEVIGHIKGSIVDAPKEEVEALAQFFYTIYNLLLLSYNGCLSLRSILNSSAAYTTFGRYRLLTAGETRNNTFLLPMRR